jgi:hypothetical protein
LTAKQPRIHTDQHGSLQGRVSEFSAVIWNPRRTKSEASGHEPIHADK